MSNKLLTILSLVAGLLVLLVIEQLIYAWQLHCPNLIKMSLIPKCVQRNE